MATPVQNLNAIVGGFLNRAATAKELTRIGEALAFMRIDVDYATKTAAQKAEATVEHMFQIIYVTVKQVEDTKARAIAVPPVDPDFVPAP